MMCATCVTRWRPSVGRGGAQVFAVIIQPCVEFVEKVSYLLSGMPGNGMLASSKCARYGSNLGTNHGPGRGEDEMGSAVVCPRGCRFCAVLWSENAANLPATNSRCCVCVCVCVCVLCSCRSHANRWSRWSTSGLLACTRS